MHPIRAFVGHSFNESDEAVVRAFLDILESISSLHPEFTWTHAKRPEPVEVTQKVLALLQDKNVFIGICTKKECVVTPAALKPMIFSKKRMSVAKEDVQWKASDWVIQEIGLCIGLNLKIVLLIEDGVRLPGALQGNLEYITFDRNSPEKVTSTLIHMLSSLSPSITSAASEEKAPSVALLDEHENRDLQIDFYKPAQGWSQEQYEAALRRNSIRCCV